MQGQQRTQLSFGDLDAARHVSPEHFLVKVTNKGEARWMIIEEAFNADRLIEFMEALTKDAGKKVFLILDNLRVHHSKPVKAWLEKAKEKIEVFYLPSYSPELNPEERLNADLKLAIGSKVPARTKAKLRDAANEHMAFLKDNPERVKSFFQDPASNMPLNTICWPDQ